jgi:uncharacterized protein
LCCEILFKLSFSKVNVLVKVWWVHKAHQILQLLASFAFFALSLVLLSSSALADIIPIPALKSPVTDLTQTLSLEQNAQLSQQLLQFSQTKGSQIAVLIVPTTMPEDIAQYSIRAVEAWKLGREKQDDGVLVLVAMQDKKMRIEVGYGLEGAIPDLVAKRIIDEVMMPAFKQGDFYGGIQNATMTIMRLIEGEQLPAPTQQNQDSNLESMLPLLLFGGLIFGGILRSIFGEFFGGALTGGAIGVIAWILGGGLIMAIVFGIIAFVVTLSGAAGLIQAGALGGRGIGGGGFGGMGGGFGGGGASGGW